MARTPNPSSHEVIYIDDEPDTSGPVQPHRPTPEIKSEADSDASSSTRVFARSRAPPAISADLRKQIVALKKTIHQNHVATIAADTQEQGRQAIMDIAAQFGLSITVNSATGSPSGRRARRSMPGGGSSPIEEDEIDEQERGRRAEYQRKRDEIIAPGVDESELTQEDAAELRALDSLERSRLNRRREDLAREREDESPVRESSREDDSLFVRRKVGARVSMAELLDDDHALINANIEMPDDDDNDAADGPIAGPSSIMPGRRHGKHPTAARPISEINSLTSFNLMNVQFDDSIPDQPVFGPGTTLTTTEALKALQRVILNRNPHISMDGRRKIKADLESLSEAISWFCGQGRSVRPAANQDGWTIAGLKPGTTVKHYQVFAAGWMRQLERFDRPRLPKGGFLADSMGLGKTLTCLICIIDSRPLTIPRRQPRLTLIVAPRALLDQWHEEITSRCEESYIGRVYRFYGEGKKHAEMNDVDFFNDYTIVLTTYHEVMASWPDQEPPKELDLSAEERRKWHLNTLENKCGLLHRIKWNRVILDEVRSVYDVCWIQS